MSFGFSPSDIISLIQLTTKTYQKWKNACGEYTRLTGELRSLQVILQALEEEVRVPTSLLRHHDNGLRRLATITSDCSMIVRELNVIITNHKSLGSSRARNWDRLKFGHTHLTGLLQRLQSQLTALGTYLDVLGAGSLGRLEESVRNLPEMKRVIDDIAAQMRCGRREGTVMTDYGDDDKEVWRAFRRELISEGFSSKDLQKAKGTLSGYLKRMKDAGLFEEETLQETTTEDRAFTISEVLSESTEEFPVGSAAIDDAEPRVYIMNSGIDPRDLRKFRSGDQDFHSILSFGPDIVSISEASLASPLNCLYGRKFTMYRNCILNGETPPKISTVDDLESYIYSIALQRVNLFKVDPAYDNVNLSNKVVVILHVWLFRQPETEWNAGTWVSDYSVDTVCDPTDKRAIMLPALRASWRPDLKFYTHSPLRDNSSVDEDTDQSRPGYSAIFSGEGDAVKPPVTIGSKPHDAINHYLMDLASPSKTDVFILQQLQPLWADYHSACTRHQRNSCAQCPLPHQSYLTLRKVSIKHDGGKVSTSHHSFELDHSSSDSTSSQDENFRWRGGLRRPRLKRLNDKPHIHLMISITDDVLLVKEQIRRGCVQCWPKWDLMQRNARDSGRVFK